MGQFVKKVQAKEAVMLAVQKHLKEIGGRKYSQIIIDVMDAINDLPQYNLYEDYSNIVERVD